MSAVSIQRIWGAALTLWGVAILLVARQFPRLADHHPGPALFPALVGSGFVITGILLVLLKPHDAAWKPITLEWHRGLIVLGLCLLLPWVAFMAGFMIPLAIIVAVVAWLAGLSWWKALIAGSLTGVVIFYLFTNLLRVPL